MIEYYRFLNSPDVARYLAKEHYAFTAAQAAWAVFHSRRATLAEKICGFEQIMRELPDDPTVGTNGLHDLLRRFSEKKRWDIDAFLLDEGACIYAITDLPARFEDICLYGGKVFTSFEACADWGIRQTEEVETFTIVKMLPDGDICRRMTFRTADGACMDVLSDISGEIGVILKDALRTAGAQIPLPFRAGSFVYDRDAFIEPIVFCDAGGKDNPVSRGYVQLPDGAVERKKFSSDADWEYYPCGANNYGEESIDNTPSDGLLLFSRWKQGLLEDYILCEELYRWRVSGCSSGQICPAERIKIWLDENVAAPVGYTWCRTREQVKKLLRCSFGSVDLIDAAATEPFSEEPLPASAGIPKLCATRPDFPLQEDLAALFGDTNIPIRYHGGDIRLGEF